MAEIDINNIVTDLNAKLDRDLSNITNDLSENGAQKLAGVLKETYRETLSTIATNDLVGQVKPDGQILTVDQDGTLRINLVDLVYPVGAIYISVTDVNPGSLIGGIWERIQEKFLLSCSSNYPAGSTGGEFSHTLTVQEIPSHNHTQNPHNHDYSKITTNGDSFGIYGGGGKNGWGLGIAGTNNNYGRFGIVASTATNNPTGGGLAHNNTPPYLAVYMFKRIS